MTYNFDTERWYDTQLELLERRRAAGELDQAAFDEAVRDLDARYDEMVERLSKAYQL